MVLAWLGTSPQPALRRALSRAGFVVRAGRSREGRPLTVVASPRGARPPKGIGGEWLWVCSDVSAARQREAVLAGAYDVIDPSKADAQAQLLARLNELRHPPAPLPPAPTLVTSGLVGRALLQRLALAARTSMPVLLIGETGSGKEVAARLIHAWSGRQGAFVPINCGAIPNELMEAELFGYARGAFSGAVAGYEGLIASAEHGTVFLDEIDDTPLSLQSKLLRVLEDRVVSRLGDSRYREIDFRFIAATNRDLRPLIASGAFGADLYERLAIVSIELPPLRERLEDLPDLCRHFMARFASEEPLAKERPPVTEIDQRALGALREYAWPGNIRELRNVIFESLVYKRRGATLLLSDLPRRIVLAAAAGTGLRGAEAGPRGGAAPGEDSAPIDDRVLRAQVATGRFNLRLATQALQRAALREALHQAGGNAAGAARLLREVGRGRSRDPGSTVRAMMRRLGVREDDAARRASGAPSRTKRGAARGRVR